MLPTSKEVIANLKLAEESLENARKLAASVSTPSPMTPEEEQLRRNIGIKAKAFAFEAAPAIDIARADVVTLADVGAWNIFIDWKAFDHIPLEGSISYVDLAKAVDAQESLVTRIARLLVAVGKLEQNGADRVSHTRISRLYRSDNPTSVLMTVGVGMNAKGYVHWPEYFAKYGRKEAQGQTHTPFSFGWGHPELPAYEVMSLYPKYATAFAKSMKSAKPLGGDIRIVGPGALYDVSWIGEEARVRAGDGQPLIVDVGGGLGHLLRDILTELPGLSPSQCVLQDRGHVVAEARQASDPVLQGISMIDHDFHQEQPVKGASLYLIRRCLLNYSDEVATDILRHLAQALPVDDPKARVIIMDPLRVDTPNPEQCKTDLSMINLGGKLRNEKMYTEIVNAAGLKVVNFFARVETASCVIECARS